MHTQPSLSHTLSHTYFSAWVGLKDVTLRPIMSSTKHHCETVTGTMDTLNYVEQWTSKDPLGVHLQDVQRPVLEGKTYRLLCQGGLFDRSDSYLEFLGALRVFNCCKAHVVVVNVLKSVLTWRRSSMDLKQVRDASFSPALWGWLAGWRWVYTQTATLWL